MKKIRNLALFVTISLLLGACTQNNGNIGNLFGSWHLTEMLRDGQPFAQPVGSDTFWSFQSNVIMVTFAKEHQESIKYYGSFSQLNDGLLSVNFTHHSNDIPQGTGLYMAPEWMGFPATGVFNLAIAESPKNKLVLTYTTSENVVYIYKFTKTW